MDIKDINLSLIYKSFESGRPVITSIMLNKNDKELKEVLFEKIGNNSGKHIEVLIRVVRFDYKETNDIFLDIVGYFSDHKGKEVGKKKEFIHITYCPIKKVGYAKLIE